MQFILKEHDWSFSNRLKRLWILPTPMSPAQCFDQAVLLRGVDPSDFRCSLASQDPKQLSSTATNTIKIIKLTYLEHPLRARHCNKTSVCALSQLILKVTL